jgi:hypothetical protein
MPLTILSEDGMRRVIVSETQEGIACAFFRRVHDGLRGKSPGEPPTEWRYMRTSIIPHPFHVALDIAHAVVQEAG